MKILSTLILALMLAAPLLASNAVNFHVVLSGDEEVPPVDTDTTGAANFHVNQALTEIDFKIDVRDADGILGIAGAHLHCNVVGQNGGVVVFLAGPFTPGFDGELQWRGTLSDANIINPACGATIAELVEAMLDGRVYVNVHSSDFPGGEIRGQVD